jgi:hypothetical protein
VPENYRANSSKLSRRILRSAEQSWTTDSWVESYLMDDRVYCVYIAANEELIREHARQGGFPANRISEVHAIIDPTTAESATR